MNKRAILGWLHLSARVFGVLIMLLLAFILMTSQASGTLIHSRWEAPIEAAILVIAAPLLLWGDKYVQ